MKLAKILLILALPMVLIMGCSKMDPVQDEEMILKAGKGGTVALDLNGPHFELNLLGKKDGWNSKVVDNPERHTIFIPRFTEGWTIPLNTPNNLGLTELDGVRIDISQNPVGTDFVVLDGSVFDEVWPAGRAAFQLPAGKYRVVIAMRGKKNVDPAYLAAWLEALETTTVDGNVTETLWYYQNLGSVTVSRKWQEITGLFTITQTEAGGLPWIGGNDPVWIFDYMNWLGDQSVTIDGETMTYSDIAYFWQLMNNGSQLIKVRFYPV